MTRTPRSNRSAARRIRAVPTLGERELWRLLRDRRLQGAKFRRQAPIGPYIVDFACFGRRLVVEVDGYFHSLNAEREPPATHGSLRKGIECFAFPTA